MRLRKSMDPDNIDPNIDCGTLRQLQKVINRRNVKDEPKDNFSACEDYLLLVVKCHILCAAMEYLNMDSLESTPTCDLIADDFWVCLKEDLQDGIANAIIDDTVDLSLKFRNNPNADSSNDNIKQYGQEVISFRTIVHEL